MPPKFYAYNSSPSKIARNMEFKATCHACYVRLVVLWIP